MPKLIIDDQPIEVAEGTKVIEAAEMLGIMIPRFCFHPALGAVGACRVCAVKFVEGPIKGIEMSCMVNSKDGMKVSTTDPEAVDFRKHVIEWLMLNHPHDCPVCDEGGHCLLQDETVAGGHGIRLYKGKKRTHVDQYIGPLLQHEMNRCIQCYRCVRFYQEFAGYKDLGVMSIANRLYFGRYKEGNLRSPFSGNVIDICPTGVFTDKPSRYTGRRWDFERTPGICIHCSLGCHITVSARNRQIVRMEARFSHPVNGYFICDRGRYGFAYNNDIKRPRAGKVFGEEADPVSAINRAAKELERISNRFGVQAIAVIGSCRSSFETMAALKNLCQATKWQGPVLFTDKNIAHSIKTALSCLAPEIRISMRQIEPADVILVAGADPLNEAPMTAIAMRQASREGAKIFAIDPRPLDWPFEFEHVPCAPRDIPSILKYLRKQILSPLEGHNPKDKTLTGEISAISLPDSKMLASVISALTQSHRPALISSTEFADEAIISETAELAQALRQMNKQAGLFYIFPQANSAGAAIIDEPQFFVSDMVEKIESDEIKALITVESDIWDSYPDRVRLTHALNRLELLVCLDCISTPFFEKANIQIPIQTVFEAGGTYINQEGRGQRISPAYAGGIPIAITGKGDHPPRVFSSGIPGGDILPAWKIIYELSGGKIPEAGEALLSSIAEVVSELPEFFKVMNEDGVRIDLKKFSVSASPPASIPKSGDFLLLPVSSIFGDEPLSSFSSWLKELENPPSLWMSTADAEKLGAASGDQVRLNLKFSSIELALRVSAWIPEGILVMPRHRAIFWQQFEDGSDMGISYGQIEILKKYNLKE